MPQLGHARRAEDQRHRDPHEADRPSVLAIVGRRGQRAAARRGNQPVKRTCVTRARERQRAAGEDDERVEVLCLAEVVRESHQIGADVLQVRLAALPT